MNPFEYGKEVSGYQFYDRRKSSEDLHRRLDFKTIVPLGLMLLVGCGERKIERIEWPVMGTVAAVQTRGATVEETAEVVRAVKAEFARVEKLLNAHDPNSELSRLAPLAEQEILETCDPAMKPCYELAFAWRETTHGAFNPRWRGTNTLDLGAIAKGFAVDLAAARVPKGNCDVLLDLGGNLRAVRGDWKVGIAGSCESFELEEHQSCATSAEYYRGKHIYDGRTGLAVSNDVVSVTVVATEAMYADLLSTTAFIFGPEESKPYLDGWHTYSAVWIMRNGRKISWAPTQ